MIDDDRFEGSVRHAGGKLADVVTRTTGDAATQAHEKAIGAAGHVQDLYRQAVDEVRQLTTDKPFSVLFAAMGIGLAVGLLSGRR